MRPGRARRHPWQRRLITPVTEVSPVLDAALRAAGLDAGRLLDVAWSGQRNIISMLRGHPLMRDGGRIHLMDAGGVLGRCEVKRHGDCLDVCLALNAQATVSTRHGVGLLTVEAVLPAVATVAAAGLPICALIEHPLLAGQDHRIIRIRPMERLGLTQVTFAAPPVAVTTVIVDQPS